MARILIVRPLAQGLELQERLQKIGHNVDICEIAKIEHINFEFEPINPFLLVFTSQNAVDAFALQQNLRDCQVFAVGAKTASKLHEYGFKNVTITGEDVDDLLIFIKANIKNDIYIYYICGEIITKEATIELSKMGYKAEKLVVYKTIYSDNLNQKIKETFALDPYDFVMFFSQNTAENFVKLITEAGLENCFKTSNAITISSKVAQMLKKICWQNIEISDKKNSDSMIKLISEGNMDNINEENKQLTSGKKTIGLKLGKIIAFSLIILAITIVFVAVRFSLKEYKNVQETEKMSASSIATQGQQNPADHAPESLPPTFVPSPAEDVVHKKNQILTAAYNLEISLNQGQVSVNDIETLKDNITDLEVKAALSDLELFGMNVVDKDEFHEEAIKSRKSMIILERKAANDDRFFSNYIGNFIFITDEDEEGADRKVNDMIKAITKQDYAQALSIYEKLSAAVKNKHQGFETKLTRLVKLQSDLSVIRNYITKESGVK